MYRSILRPVSCHLVSRLLVVPFGQLPSATRLNKTRSGYETSLLYLAILIALVLDGSGPLALDRFLPPARLHVTEDDIQTELPFAALTKLAPISANRSRQFTGVPP
jgi:hypothetical protein